MTDLNENLRGTEQENPAAVPAPAAQPEPETVVEAPVQVEAPVAVEAPVEAPIAPEAEQVVREAERLIDAADEAVPDPNAPTGPIEPEKPAAPEEDPYSAYKTTVQPPRYSESMPFTTENMPPDPEYQPPHFSENYAKGPDADQTYPQYEPYQPPYPPQYPAYTQKSRFAACLLALMFGVFGVHNFYMGRYGAAVAQLLITLLTCGWGALISEVWAIVEAVGLIKGTRAVDGHGIPFID